MAKKKKVDSKENAYFVLEEIDELRAFVRLKNNGLYYAYLEWFEGDDKRPNQWMLRELVWLGAINEASQKGIVKKVVAAIDLLKLAEFMSEESVNKSRAIQADMVKNAQAIVEKAMTDNKKQEKK